MVSQFTQIRVSLQLFDVFSVVFSRREYLHRILTRKEMKRKTLITIAVATTASLSLSLADEDQKKPEAPPRPAGEDGRPPREGRPPGGPQTPSLQDADTDKDGSISKQEWTDFMVKMAKERAERSFGFLDRDNNGTISKEELEAVRNRRPGGGRPGEGRGPKGDGKGKGKGDGEGPKRPPLEE